MKALLALPLVCAPRLVVCMSLFGGLTISLVVGCSHRSAEVRAPAAVVSEQARVAFDRGVRHMQAGADEYEQAIAAFRAALQSAPDLWEAHLDIGILELRRARLSLAARALQQSITIHPSVEALEALGEVFVRQGRAKEAVELYERALRRNPADLVLRNQLAVALRHAGRLDESEAEIRAILGRDAANVDAHGTLAAIHLDRKNIDLAELVLNKGLKRHPEDPRLLTNMGLVALARGDDQAAFEFFEKASTNDPSFLRGRLNKAAVFLGAGDHSRAREELEYVLRIEPGSTQALLGLGIAYRLAGELTHARASWERLLSIDPDHAAAHFNLAVLDMDFNGRPAAAREHLERYLQLVSKDEPNAEAARQRLVLLDALQKG